MNFLKNKFAQFQQDESGATMIEYALIAALIAIAAIATMQALGTEIQAAFTDVKSAVSTARTTGAPTP